jgi:glycosyltransferase involved in cell wall biosynthesis
MISVLILTLNEEVNMTECLESVAWSDDVLVLDSFSIDRTCELARKGKARVMQRAFDTFANQRNYGLTKGELKYDWVLHLDADERVTPALYEEMKEAIKENKYPAYRMASKLIMDGSWLKHAGMYPSYQVRFGKRDILAFAQVGHGQREGLPADQIGTLKNPLIHLNFSKGLTDWFERHNRYSTDEAKYALSRRNTVPDIQGLFSLQDRTRRRRAQKDMIQNLPFRPFFRFLYVYLLKRGFLDGRVGFRYSVLMAIYEYMIMAKIREFDRKAPGR